MGYSEPDDARYMFNFLGELFSLGWRSTWASICAATYRANTCFFSACAAHNPPSDYGIKCRTSFLLFISKQLVTNVAELCPVWDVHDRVPLCKNMAPFYYSLKSRASGFCAQPCGRSTRTCTGLHGV